MATAAVEVHAERDHHHACGDNGRCEFQRDYLICDRVHSADRQRAGKNPRSVIRSFCSISATSGVEIPRYEEHLYGRVLQRHGSAYRRGTGMRSLGCVRHGSFRRRARSVSGPAGANLMPRRNEIRGPDPRAPVRPGGARCRAGRPVPRHCRRRWHRLFPRLVQCARCGERKFPPLWAGRS